MKFTIPTSISAVSVEISFIFPSTIFHIQQPSGLVAVLWIRNTFRQIQLEHTFECKEQRSKGTKKRANNQNCCKNLKTLITLDSTLEQWHLSASLLRSQLRNISSAIIIIYHYHIIICIYMVNCTHVLLYGVPGFFVCCRLSFCCWIVVLGNRSEEGIN